MPFSRSLSLTFAPRSKPLKLPVVRGQRVGERALQHVHREASIVVEEHAAERGVAPGHVEQLLVECPAVRLVDVGGCRRLLRRGRLRQNDGSASHGERRSQSDHRNRFHARRSQHRRLSRLLINASFRARLQGFSSRSRFSAALSDSHSSEYTSDTGRRDRVYLAPLPELWTWTLAWGSRAYPVYNVLSAQRTIYTKNTA